MAVEVRFVDSDDRESWRTMRLRSLRESPAAFGSTYEREAAYDDADWAKWDGSPAVLAWRDGEPVAMGAGYPDQEGWLQIVAMWTAPEARGLGIARLVLDELVAWAAARRLRVHLCIALTNPAARGVYEKYGFVPTGEVLTYEGRDGMQVEMMELPGESHFPSA